MRRWLLLLAGGLFLVPAGMARGQDDVRSILDRAIKAHGGEEKLAKYRAGRVKTKGRIELGGGVEFTEEVAYQAPDKLREALDLEVNGEKVKVVTVINGGKAAITVNGKKLPLNDKLKEALRDSAQLLQMARLLPLRGKGFDLAPLGEVKVNDRPAVGIRVSRQGARDVNLYFDKKTGLLTKVERRAVDPMSGQEFTEERIIKEYQKVDGIAAPKRAVMRRDGERFLDAEVVEVQHLEAIDDGEFNVP